MAWMPALFGLMVIFFESTATMSGANTYRWLMDICHALWGRVDTHAVEMANTVLRKVGHICGYGVLGLMFRRGWARTAPMFVRWSRKNLRLLAGGLAVWSVFGVACMDEWHQIYLPGRTSSPYDVLIDTCGALLFNAALLYVLARRRRLASEIQTTAKTKYRGSSAAFHTGSES